MSLALVLSRVKPHPSFIRRAINVLARTYLRFALPSGSNDRSKKVAAEIKHDIWIREAAELGIQTDESYGMMSFRGKDGRLLRLGLASSSISCESQLAGLISGDKALTSNLLREAGIRVPEGRSFPPEQETAAVHYALSILPCVVKPARWTDYGIGVSLQPATPKEILRAFRIASLYSAEVLVERFIPGENYRLLVYRGKCLSVNRRDVAHVTGDGIHKVIDLVQRENDLRIKDYNFTGKEKLLMPLPAGERASQVLRSQGLEWDTVAEQGRVVRLWDVCNYQHGTSFKEVLDEAHPEIVKAAEQAAVIVGAVVAGVDVISPDIRHPVYSINEVNTNPGLLPHYAVSDGKRPIRTLLLGELGMK